MDVKERIRQYIARKGISERRFCLEAGLSATYVNSIRKSIQPDKLRQITAAFPDLNPAWVFTGEGEMLREGALKPAGTEGGIPFYDIDVTASIAEAFCDVSEEAQYRINFPPLNDCTAAFPVYGESMVPDFFPGEVVLVREITHIDSMLWGEPYLIITDAFCDNLRTLKNVYLSEDRQHFILRATNPRYAGDTIISRDHVLKLFLVKGKVSRLQF